MSALGFEVLQIVRGFSARPALVAVIVLTLALGIGASSAIFSAVDALLLRSLPYPQAEQLVMLWADGTERGFARQEVVNPGVVQEWQRSLTTVESVAAFNPWESTLTSDAGSVLIEGLEVSASFFATLRVFPRQGRDFSAADDVPDGPRVIIVSHAFWQHELGGDPGALGRPVELDRQTWTVIGILPAEFVAPGVPRAGVFKPLQGNPDPRGGFWLSVIGRLQPGVSIGQADAELDAVQARLAEEYADELHGLTGYVQPLGEALVQDVRRQLLVLLGATFLVLLIACANNANLLLARAIGRARELAIRSAVGASRNHIIRQVLLESLLLALPGMLLGTGIAWLGIRWMASALPSDLAATVALGLDTRVLGFAFIIALLGGLVSGSLPALIACRRDAGDALRDGDRTSSGGREGRRARAMLVAGTFALALALTVSAGLFLKSLLRILEVDPGFRAEHVLTFSLSLPETHYPDADALRRAQQALLDQLTAVPGVTAAGFTSTLPMGDLITDTGTALEGIELAGDPLRTWYSRVTPGYLPALGVPLVRGRDIAATDHADAPCAVVANETYVRRYLGAADPIGRKVLLNPRSEQPLSCEIVGLARDLRFSTLAAPPDPTLYLPAGRFPNRRFFVVLRTAGDPLALQPVVRRAIAGFDPGLALWKPAPMEELVRNSLRTPRLVTMLVGAFAALALLLATSGVYGVTAYNVTARLREFGVRTALGARQSDLLRQVLGGGLRVVAAGMAAGVALTLASGRLLDALLYEVEPFDAGVLGTVSVLLVLAATLAMLLPARRAARVPAVEALRHE